jgi:hypothetical protein
MGMKNKIYIVTAYRHGDRFDHSYNLGVFQKKQKAKQVADSHCEYRGLKYACVVDKCVLNQFDNDADYYTEEVYRSQSVSG